MNKNITHSQDNLNQLLHKKIVGTALRRRIKVRHGILYKSFVYILNIIFIITFIFFLGIFFYNCFYGYQL